MRTDPDHGATLVRPALSHAVTYRHSSRGVVSANRHKTIVDAADREARRERLLAFVTKALDPPGEARPSS